MMSYTSERGLSTDIDIFIPLISGTMLTASGLPLQEWRDTGNKETGSQILTTMIIKGTEQGYTQYI